MINDKKIADYFIDRTVMGKCIREFSIDSEDKLITIEAEWVPFLWAVGDVRLKEFDFEGALTGSFISVVNKELWVAFLTTYKNSVDKGVNEDTIKDFFRKETVKRVEVACWDTVKSSTFYEVKILQRHLKKKFNITGYEINFMTVNNVSFVDDFFEVVFNSCLDVAFLGCKKMLDKMETYENNEAKDEKLIDYVAELLEKKSDQAIYKYFDEYSFGSGEMLSELLS